MGFAYLRLAHIRERRPWLLPDTRTHTSTESPNPRLHTVQKPAFLRPLRGRSNLRLLSFRAALLSTAFRSLDRPLSFDRRRYRGCLPRL